MRRGVILNFVIIAILVFLILLPVMIMGSVEFMARANGCNVHGMTWGEGICSDLYAVAFLTGLVGSITSIIFVGVLVIYFLGLAIYFLIRLLRDMKAGRPVSPVAKGMVISSLVLIGAVGCILGAVWTVNWYQSSFISACQGLPGPIRMEGVQNGPLALGVKLPYPEGRPEQYVIQITSVEGEVFNTIKELPASKSPAWSPDGRQIAYAAQSKSSGKWGLYLANPLDGQTGPAILENDHEMEWPDWVPDGEALVFERPRDASGVPSQVVYQVNLDGSNLYPLTGSQPGEVYESRARYSPDGKQIIYVSKTNLWADIYRMDADGSNLRQLTFNKQDDTDPAWSPDGKWIVFAASRKQTGYYNLYIMAPDGTNQCQLTHGAKTDWKPVWSPDGGWIAYIAWGENKVYKIRPDGSELTQIPLPAELTPLSVDWARKP
jgi:sugar lactone lactonase YvrE